MTWTMKVRWDKTFGRFLAKLKVEVPKATEKKPNSEYEIKDGVTYDLKVTATGPNGDEVLSFSASFSVADDGGKPRARPEGDKKWGAPADKIVHPRVRTTSVPVKNGKGAVLVVELDLRFIDITGFLKKTSTTNSRQDFSKAYGETSPHRCQVRFYEYTSAENPKLWAVAVPDAAAKKAKVGALLFYRPSIKIDSVYKNAEDADFSVFFRYLDTPKDDDTHPFYGQRPQNPKREPNAHLEKQNKKKKPPSDYWWPYPWCAFDQQLAESGKPVVLMFPIPTRGMLFTQSADEMMRRNVDALLAALWADGLLGKEEGATVKCGRLALGAHSAGGDVLWGALTKEPPKLKKHNYDFVDEIYLFDPNNIDNTAHHKTLEKWAKAGSGRKLRMVGQGWRYPHMKTLAQNIKDAAVSVFPSELEIWQSAKQFQDALRINDDNESQPVSGLAKRGETSPASTISGVYFVKHEAPIRCLLCNVDGTKKATLKNITVGEAAAILYRDNKEKTINKSKQESSYQESIAHLKRVAGREVHEIRHQWVVVGGVVDGDEKKLGDRRKNLKGYLQIFLKDSGF